MSTTIRMTDNTKQRMSEARSMWLALQDCKDIERVSGWWRQVIHALALRHDCDHKAAYFIADRWLEWRFDQEDKLLPEMEGHPLRWVF